MQNKPNLGNDKMNLTIDITSIYKNISAGSGQKTKPIQTQFKANLTQNKPNLSQYKANKANWSEAQILSLSKGTNPIPVPGPKSRTGRPSLRIFISR